MWFFFSEELIFSACYNLNMAEFFQSGFEIVERA